MAREFTMGARLNLDTNDYSSGMAKAIRTTSNMQDSVRGLDSTMDRYTGSTAQVSGATNKMAKSTAQATEQIKGQERQMGILKSTAGGLTGVFAALGGAMAVKGAFNWLVEGNASMEQYKNTLSTVLKSEEKAVETLAWANKFAAQTPFEIPQVVEATTVMAAYGMTAQDNLGIIGDMASVMGKDLMQAVEAVADANTGELERLKEFGITKKMIEEQAALMGKQVFDKKGSMKDQEAFNDVLFTMMEDRFKGGMAMQATTFKGMLSNAQDYISTMGRTLGAPIFDSLKRGLENALEWANKLQESGKLDEWIAKVHSGFNTAGSVIKKAIPPLKAFFSAVGDVYDKTKELVDYFVDNFKKFEPFIIGIAAAFTAYGAALLAVNTWTRLVTAAQLVWNTAMSANPIGLIVLGIGLLIGALIYMAGGWDEAKKKLQVFWQGMVALWKALVPYVMAAVNVIKTTIVNWAAGIWTLVQPFLLSLLNGIKTLLSAIKSFWDVWGESILQALQIYWAFYSQIIIGVLQTIGIVVKGAFMYIYNIISGALKMAMGTIQMAWAIISGLFSVGLNLLSGNWSGAWDAMLGMLDGVWSGIKTFFSGLKDMFYDSGKAIITTLVDGIKAMASAPVKAIKAVLEKVREFLPFSDAKKGPLSNLTLNGGKIVTTMAEGIYSQQGALTNAMDGVLAPSASGSATVAAGTANPAGRTTAAAGGGKAAVIIQKLIEKIEIHGADGKNASTLVDEIIAQLYEKFKNADEILSAAGLGDLLHD